MVPLTIYYRVKPVPAKNITCNVIPSKHLFKISENFKKNQYFLSRTLNIVRRMVKLSFYRKRRKGIATINIHGK